MKETLLDSVFCIGEAGSGTITITTDSMERAVYHLKKQGIMCNYDTAVYTGNQLQSVQMDFTLNGMKVILSV